MVLIMVIKYFLLLLAIQQSKCQKSLTLVVDTTVSMKIEMDIFKINIAPVLKAIQSDNLANYILIPFDDGDLGPPFVSQSPSGITDIIEFIEVSGGNECHENSLAAIEKALRVSLPGSYIYVFTDAQANRYTQMDSIKNLCRTKKSQVVIFQSGKCESNNTTQQTDDEDNAYYEIANTCGGSIFHLDLSNFRDALRYIQEITKVDWTDINTHTQVTNNKKFTLTIDTYTKDLIISIAATHPTLQITNVYGDSMRLEKIIESNRMLVIRIQSIEIGEYTAYINCQGSAITTFYRKKEILFTYGFSPLKPRSIEETTLKPLSGMTNFMLISLPDVATVELISVSWQDSAHEDKEAEFYVLNESRGLYIAKIFIHPGSPIRISVTCRDKFNREELNGKTNLLEPQIIESPSERLKPQIVIIENQTPLINFGTSFTTVCKVQGFPKPEIWWEDDNGAILPSESALLEMPLTYISYVSIANLTRNQTVYCKSKNSEGKSELSIDLYVNRTFTFDVIQFPTDTTIKYGDSGKLYCEVNAYPDAEIKWYHNDTLMKEELDIQIIPEDHILIIHNMSVEHTGQYKCEVSNVIESRNYLSHVYISGLEAPEIEFEKSELILKPGDWTELECTVIKGIPTPKVTWKYTPKTNELNNQLPEGVFVNGKSLKIHSADKNNGGLYVCEAVNLLGVASKGIAVKVQYAPKVKNNIEGRIVNVGERVELSCDVDAVPTAEVYWEMFQDDVLINFDYRHHTDDRNTHWFIASSNDSGMYHCIAQNDMGRATRTVTLNVFVPPYIEPLPWEILTVKTGMTIVLPCNILYGNPVPVTRWQHINIYRDTIVKSGIGTLDLVLQNITRKQEGTYQCVANNEVSIDSVKVVLKID